MNRRGFTLIEMTVVIAIIILIVTLILTVVGRVRASADQTRSLEALKQMGIAYSAYYQDNNGKLLPGFPGADATSDLMVDVLKINYPGSNTLSNVKLPHLRPSGNTAFLNLDDARTYVFRLATYMDNSWETMCSEYSESARLALQGEYDAGRYGGPAGNGTMGPDDIGIAFRPSFGLNSIFLGGDTLHGDPSTVVPYNPWGPGGTANDMKVATRYSQIKNTSTLIVFAPARAAIPSGALPYPEEELGYFELRAPFTVYDKSTGTWDDRQWYIGSGEKVVLDSGGDFSTDEGGIPVTRKQRGTLPIVHADGSTEPANLTSISEDMRRWAPTPD